MKYACRFTGEFFDIESTEFQLEIVATLDSSGRGGVYHTLGSGTNSSSAASGAGHGSVGGSASNGVSGGQSYGSIYEPTALGARGGSSPLGIGTRGGGTMRIRVGHKFILDGLLIADGLNVQGATGTSRNFIVV